jgi:hypothetical protein
MQKKVIKTQIDALLNDAFTPLRQIESLIRKLDKNAAKSEFSEFVKIAKS